MKVLAGVGLLQGIHYKFCINVDADFKDWNVYYVSSRLQLYFLQEAVYVTGKNKSIALNAIISIILSLTIFGARDV